jgi:5-(carboxyamino)imidazole ribonucleotide mutase/phosphoribosylaminoimidazole-succinocarboxamide synthase
MNKPLVVIIAGSKSDEAHYKKNSEAVNNFDVEAIVRIGSAHKTAEHVLHILRECESIKRPKVYITVAGRSNALSGFVDGAVLSPVIACPPPSESFGGADVFSSLRMPSGIAPALVLDPSNAAWLAVKILALEDKALFNRIERVRQQNMQQILKDDAEIYDPHQFG